MEETAAAMGSTPFWYQLYWSTDEALVDSMIKRAENCGAQALVVTLDTTILGWRPRDLNLGSLPFARGQGIAQYTSDPRFLEVVQERVAAAVTAERVKPRVTLRAVRTLVSRSREHPGVGKQLAITRAACRSRGIPRDLFKSSSVMGSHCDASGSHVSADRAEGNPASRRRSAGDRAGYRRDDRFQSWRQTG